METACRSFDDGFVFIFYCVIRVAEYVPDKFDRTELRDKLFRGIAENYPGSKDALLAPLYYELLFDYDTR